MKKFSVIIRLKEIAGTRDAQQIYNAINGDALKEQTEVIRTLFDKGETNKYSEEKKKLYAVTFSGTFKKGRKTEDLETYSQLICLDFDKIATPQEVQHSKEIIKGIPFTHLVFTSPSGYGLKVVVKVDSSKEQHKEAYQQIAKFYEDEIGTKADHTSDIARLCFLCHDADAYYNADSEVYHFENKVTVIPAIQKDRENNPTDWNKVFMHAVNFTSNVKQFENGGRNNFVHLLASNCNKYGIPKEQTIKMCISDYTESGFNEREIETAVNSAYKRVELFNTRPQKSMESNYSNQLVPIKGGAETNIATPYFNDEIFTHLPPLIRDLSEMFSNKRERDMYLLSYVTILSGFMPTVNGWYRDENIHSNIFSFIVAPSASGKSIMTKTASLFTNMFEGGIANRIKVMSPSSKFKSLVKQLKTIDGTGVLFDPEVEALGEMHRYDPHGINLILKNAYDNVAISDARGDRPVIVDKPVFSFLIGGNQKQIGKLIPGTNDGLFSRFLIYTFDETAPFTIDKSDNWMHFVEQKDGYTDALGAFVNYTLQHLFTFELANNQIDILADKGLEWQDKYNGKSTVNMDHVIKRGGRTVFKLASILTAYKRYSIKNTDTKYTCNDNEFTIALSMVETLLEHSYQAGKVLQEELGINTVPKQEENKVKLLSIVPDCFTRRQALDAAKELKIRLSERTIDNYLHSLHEKGVLDHTHDNYCKKTA